MDLEEGLQVKDPQTRGVLKDTVIVPSGGAAVLR